MEDADTPSLTLGPFDRGAAHFDEGRVLYDFVSTRFGAGAVLLDVGAHQGASLRPFCEAGWRVHAFEPDPANRTKLVDSVRPEWDLTINPLAVAETDGDIVPFYSSPESSGVSSLSPFLDSHKQVTEIETVRLETYCANAAVDRVDCLKVDTEGHDLFVLKSFPWDVHQPMAIECEFEDAKTVPLGYTSDDLAQFLVAQGYEVIVSEWHPIVRYGITHDFKSLWPYEPGAIPEDAWGNFLAVRGQEARDELIGLIREAGADPHPARQRDRGTIATPAGFPASPSAVPRLPLKKERTMTSLRSTPAATPAATQAVPSASRVSRAVSEYIRFYTSATGLILALAIALMAIGFTGIRFGWLAGIAGLALLAVFLPYRLTRIDARHFEHRSQTNESLRSLRSSIPVGASPRAQSWSLAESTPVPHGDLGADVGQLAERLTGGSK